jgi:hypothetical protein
LSLPGRSFCWLAASLLLAGCHSASFQSAKIRDGVNTVVGVTRLSRDVNPDISDYSVFIKGEIGWAARRRRFGYSLGLTAVAPFKNRYRDLFASQEIDLGTFPNEWAGVLPEFKLQFPRALPVDITLDLRFMTFMPERVSLLASRDFTAAFTLYGSYSYTTAIGDLLSVGSEINITRKVSILVESSIWMSEHEYPADFSGTPPRYPHTVGVGFSYHLPRTSKQHHTRDLATP